MSSLPAAWIAVGCLLLILALVMTVLFLLKSREVATLKKQCEDLRDTMRMMRYEEANLARMLHTASKSTTQPMENPMEEFPIAEEPMESLAESVAPIAEELVEDVSEECDAVSEEPIETSSEEVPVSAEEIPADEMIETEAPVEPIELVENEESAQPLEHEDLVEPLVEESAAEAPLTETLQVENPTPHKHPINERRPAIPADLFSAWFAENEEVQVVAESAPQEEAVATEDLPEGKSPIVSTEQIAVVDEPLAEAPQDDTPQAMDAAPQVDVETVSEAPAQEAELSKDDERFCRKLERIVNTRLRNPNLNIDIIAAQFGIGRTNFYRKVRELTGMSPNDYLRKCRMERAAELLRTTDLPVSEVCAQVGVPDAQYFSKVFKIYFETTPTAYREQTR